MPQEFNFPIFEKVIDIVIAQAGYYGIPTKVAYPYAEKYLKALGLWEKRHEQARMLSGGMKRRLMIARGIIHNPKILILDEPTAGVDIELRRGMWDFLRELSSSGTTIILTTHYLEEAEALCNNMAIIDHGNILVSGSIKKILSSLESEVIHIDLDRPYEHTDELSAYNIATEGDGIDVTITKKHTLDEAIRILQQHKYTIHSISPKSGRLEEFFLNSTKK